MNNKFYGIGVGVGDSEQLTVKAVKILQTLDVIIVPEAKLHSGSVAHNIAKEYLKEDVTVVPMEFPMLKSLEDRMAARKANAKIVEDYLEEGKNVGFLTIGDSMTYSTYVYLLENMQDKYKSRVETIAGISSFVDMASRFNFPLMMGDENLKVISLHPGIDVEKELQDNDNIVFMKINRDFEALKMALLKTNNMENIIMVSNSGKEVEKVYYDISSLRAEDVPYFSTLVFKKGGFSEWKKFSL